MAVFFLDISLIILITAGEPKKFQEGKVTCACRGGGGVTCTCDFTPVSAKDTRSIVQREPSSETMPASPSVMSSVFLSA